MSTAAKMLKNLPMIVGKCCYCDFFHDYWIHICYYQTRPIINDIMNVYNNEFQPMSDIDHMAQIFINDILPINNIHVNYFHDKYFADYEISKK